MSHTLDQLGGVPQQPSKADLVALAIAERNAARRAELEAVAEATDLRFQLNIAHSQIAALLGREALMAARWLRKQGPLDPHPKSQPVA